MMRPKALLNEMMKFVYGKTFLLFIVIAMSSCAATSYDEGLPAGPVHLNQLGFYPDSKKTAVFKGDAPGQDEFYLVSAENNEKVFSGKLEGPRTSPYSNATTYIADFSSYSDAGEYFVVVPGRGKSYPFVINQRVHDPLLKASIKSYYFQRMSIPLEEKYAGKWKRAAGHPDTIVFVHSSAATEKRPEGTMISAPYGWYDAGDYNKYIVNSGITVGTMLSLYEDYPELFKTYDLVIPESGNSLPDLLDEILYNLKWMLAMQDHDDGGVYHKLTTAEFEGMVMPSEATAKRYVVQKSTTATLDFAAVMAQAARVFSSFENQLPGLSDRFLDAAEKAWIWARDNPDKLYDQNEMNRRFKPAVNTGAYGDKNKEDEEAWAAAELWITTGDAAYAEATKIIAEDGFSVPNWGDVRSLGYYSLIRHQDRINSPALVNSIKSQLLSSAEEMVAHTAENAYGAVMGRTRSDFVWGSNAVAANQGIALMQAFVMTGDAKFLNAAIDNLDYLLGRNATGYSFVTGYGNKTPMHPHHRPSVADDNVDPVPGLLVGGPNPGQQDKCEYLSDNADESYIDHDCSYASNEIAINWNAPLVYLTGAIEAYKATAHKF